MLPRLFQFILWFIASRHLLPDTQHLSNLFLTPYVRLTKDVLVMSNPSEVSYIIAAVVPHETIEEFLIIPVFNLNTIDCRHTINDGVLVSWHVVNIPICFQAWV